jgi:putative proteasome-type protease
MTYCVGLCLDQGLVMASDTRTNAGVDYISSFSKLHVFQPAPDRIFVLLAAGSLATTQDVLNRIRRDLDYAASAQEQGLNPHLGLLTVTYPFEAAAYIGQLNLAAQNEYGPALRQSGISPEATFILGCQITGQPHGLFLIYPQGNFIAATPETPYLQIGESKFGKPVLDRFAHPKLSLEQGARLCLVSMDGTARSNLTVAPPFEVAIYPRDTLSLSHRLKFPADSPELVALSRSWEQALARGFQELPRFTWEQSEPAGQVQV